MTMRVLLTLLFCSQLLVIGSAQSHTTSPSIQFSYCKAEYSTTVVLGDLNKVRVGDPTSRPHFPLPTNFLAHRTADGQDSTRPTRPLVQFTFVFLTTFKTIPFTQEGSSSGQNYLLGVALVPDGWWIPAPHLWFTYTHYTYERIWLTSEWRNITSMAVYPAVKLANFLLIGYGYSEGKKYTKRQEYSRESYVTFDGKYSDRSTLIALDFDLRIYSSTYATFGAYFKQPAPFYALGISVRL